MPSTHQHESVVAYLHEFAASIGLRALPSRGADRATTWRLTKGTRTVGGRGRKDNPVLNALRNFGLTTERYIPLVYRANSREVRLDVLAGLIDGDGNLTGHGGHDIVLKDMRLADDYHAVHISGHLDQIPTRKEGRRARPREQIKDVLVTGITVEPAGEGEYFGFEIDGDRLFLLGDFTVTHNTAVFCFISQSAARRGKSVCILVHRQELLLQSSRSLEKLGVEHGLIAPGHSQTDDKVQVASVQTLVRRLEKARTPQERRRLAGFDLLVVDECFPSGTLVDDRPIEAIKVGDIVRSFNHNTGILEEQRVANIFSKRASALVTVHLRDGTHITCTPNHPIFTGDRYVQAGNLHADMCVAIHRDFRAHRTEPAWGVGQGRDDGVPGMRQANGMPGKDGTGGGASGQSILLGDVPRRVDCADIVNSDDKNEQAPGCAAYEIAEPDAERRVSREDARHHGDDWSPASDKGRKRDADTGAAATARGTSAGIGAGTHRSDKDGKRQRLPDSLQDQHRVSGASSGDRGGRRQPRFPVPEGTGHAEGRVLDLVWVDRIEVQEPGSDGRFGGLCPDGQVYNIEVEGNHNYFVSGILVHNCHHAAAGSWTKVLAAMPQAKILGVTATPCRLDNKGLSKVFDDLVVGPSIKELIDLGFLVQPVVYAPPMAADLRGVRTSGGDYRQGDVAQAMDKPAITGDAVEHYRRICPGVPAIAFCASIQHAEHVAADFTAAGIRAASLDGTMPDGQRHNLIKALGDGRIKVLTSCDIVSEGTDIPTVGAAILLRPTKSTSLCLQQVGRALRPAPGKEHAIILDHVGNIERHGLPDEEREWSLDAGAVKRKSDGDAGMPVRQCPSCYAAHSPAPRCPVCGHVYETKAREIVQQAGELKKIDAKAMAEQRALARKQKADEVKNAKSREDLEALAKRRGYR